MLKYIHKNLVQHPCNNISIPTKQVFFLIGPTASTSTNQSSSGSRSSISITNNHPNHRAPAILQPESQSTSRNVPVPHRSANDRDDRKMNIEYTYMDIMLRDKLSSINMILLVGWKDMGGHLF